MTDRYSVDFFDFILLILKNKLRLIALFFTSLVVSYLLIFFAMKPQYDSTAVLVPVNQDPMAGMMSLVKNFSAALPGGLSSLSKESETSLYNTIIFSRTSLELVNENFDLQKHFKIKRKSEMVKLLGKSVIKAKVTLDNAYTITVRTDSKQLSSDICAFVVEHLNDRIIELNISKSKINREFLENRYNEVKQKLTAAENDLRNYQVSSGVIGAETQTTQALEMYSKLEAELASKQLELEISKKMHGEQSQQAQTAKIAITEYNKKLSALHNSNDKGSLFVGISTIPDKMLDYYRLYRNVKVQSEILNFLTPLVEQARFDEQKDLPILQIIDIPIPAEKKSYPPRTLFSGISAIFVTTLFSVLLFLFQVLSNSDNKKIVLLRKHFPFFKD